jgi:hypothetical protein
VRKIFDVRSWPGDVTVGVIFLGLIFLTTLFMLGAVIAFSAGKLV